MDKRETLRVRDLFVQFETRGGIVRAVDGVSFSLRQGERLGLVGESGSGKSTIALALLRMIKPPGRIVSGSIMLDGDTDITKVPASDMPGIRFSRIAMIPQGAMNSLNPVRRIRDQFTDSMRAHGIRENDKQTKIENRRAAAIRWSSRRCREEIPARTLRWHETAGVHRNGGVVEAVGNHR